MKLPSIALLFFLLSACSSDDSENSDVAIGKVVFEANCVVCHGKEARGLVSNWKEKGADGKYPAPPLDGTAHAWHHSPLQLLNTINEGGIKMGGQMPAFENTLSDDEKQAALDYIMSLWPSELKTKYEERFK
ncbi:MAG TPA: cytochrome c [Candidatus Thioglobus sp.]|nr:cytochrome c [Candidatus Thioglobus sp.]HIL20088.1 cytochrome c [Candidatus Thioglobus sp.]